jgi:hypothetical protein
LGYYKRRAESSFDEFRVAGFKKEKAPQRRLFRNHKIISF